MKINLYKIIEECVENGINAGWWRAHKHTATPDFNHIADSIHEAVMNELCEYISFSGGTSEEQ